MRALYTCSVFVCEHVRVGSVCVCVVIMVPDWGGARFRWGVEPWGCRQVACDVTPTQKVGVIGVELWR